MLILHLDRRADMVSTLRDMRMDISKNEIFFTLPTATSGKYLSLIPACLNIC